MRFPRTSAAANINKQPPQPGQNPFTSAQDAACSLRPHVHCARLQNHLRCKVYVCPVSLPPARHTLSGLDIISVDSRNWVISVRSKNSPPPRLSLWMGGCTQIWSSCGVATPISPWSRPFTIHEFARFHGCLCICHHLPPPRTNLLIIFICSFFFACCFAFPKLKTEEFWPLCHPRERTHAIVFGGRFQHSINKL